MHGQARQWAKVICGSVALLLCVTLFQISLGSPLRVLALSNCTVTASGSNDGGDQAMLQLINSYRSRNGLAPLALSAALSRSALWKSTDMAANRYMAHDDATRSWSQRLTDCGYSYGGSGENIAYGYSDAASTFQQWQTSPPHNANMLSSSYAAIGVGHAESTGGVWYWTTDFGSVVDSSAGASAPAQSPISNPAVPTSSLLSPPPLPALQSEFITPGVTVYVNTPGDCLRGHSAPSLSAAVQGCVPDGTPLVILAGPVSSEGHVWWNAFGSGWVAGDYLRTNP